jgi:hypothetical protein
MAMADIEAKVAMVLDEYRVALNKGSSDGVTSGARVTLWRIVEIKDPDTDELLDTVRLDAARLEVAEVTPTVGIHRPARTRRDLAPAVVRAAAPRWGHADHTGAHRRA